MELALPFFFLGFWVGKRKHSGDEDRIIEDEVEMDEDLAYRPNALLMTGPPIAHLPTARIFAYSTHFDAHPMGLEWVDDNTCVLVFESIRTAREGFSCLQKSASEAPDMEDLITAKLIPMALWPPEERINQTLGKGQGLKGTIRMRWAKADDVKKKGAKNESQFYKRHGRTAGKELFNGRDLPPPKRRRRDDSQDDERQRAELDNQLDQFLAEDDDEMPTKEDDEPDVPGSPPSKMRSDYIAKDGRTLLERTSLIRLHSSNEFPDLASRLTAPLPRRARGANGATPENLGSRFLPSEKLEWGYDERRRPPRGRNGMDFELFGRSDGQTRKRRRRGRDEGEWERAGGERRRKTQQQLDDELDAFLKSHD